MLALRKTEPAPGLALAEVDEPQLQAGEIMIEVAAAGICGSDLHVDDWDHTYQFIAASLPVTLGHELAGRVIAAHDGEGRPLIGQSVVVMPSVVCGTCPRCRAGDPAHCQNRRGIGMSRNGGFAPLVAAPARNCIPLPAGLSPEIAALTEPLTVCQEAVERGGIIAGMRVLVLGPGTIGQGIALMARNAGADVIVAGHDDATRLETVAELGFDRAFDLADPTAAAALDRLAPFDVVLEATGAPSTIQYGLDRLRAEGVFVATGIHASPASFDVTGLVRNRQDIRGSYRAPLSTWPKVVDALAADPKAFLPMITHRLPLKDGLKGFTLGHARQGSKVMLIPD